MQMYRLTITVPQVGATHTFAAATTGELVSQLISHAKTIGADLSDNLTAYDAESRFGTSRVHVDPAEVEQLAFDIYPEAVSVAIVSVGVNMGVVAADRGEHMRYRIAQATAANTTDDEVNAEELGVSRIKNMTPLRDTMKFPAHLGQWERLAETLEATGRTGLAARARTIVAELEAMVKEAEL